MTRDKTKYKLLRIKKNLKKNSVRLLIIRGKMGGFFYFLSNHKMSLTGLYTYEM